MATSRAVRLWFVALSMALVGCAPAVRGTAKNATEGAAVGAVQSLSDPATRQRVAEIVGSPEMQKAIRELSDDVTSGVVDAMGSDEIAARSERLARAITDSVTRVAVDAALSQATTPINERTLKDAVEAATARAVDTGMRRMAEDMPRTLGPAVGAMVREQLVPSLRALATDPDLRASLAPVVFELSRQAVFGGNEATAELAREKPKEGALAQLSATLSAGGVLLTVLLLVLLASVVTLLIVVAFMRARFRRYELEHDLRRDLESAGIEPGHHRPSHST